MASEAVMVAPEQCATAPKTLASKQAAAPAAAKTSTTRVVLLAVLALAAATGAMFGVVVFGNEFTKDMHPKGATLVDSEDRAVATAAVESYVSLLDLPLLGTAELNKVDGITFSTHKGIEHRKVTGYTVTKETAAVGDSEVHTPRLSLSTSAPGETIVVSVRDNKAWLSEVAAGKTVVTAVDAASQRRLADGGSCLENGACLYSRDELLHLDAASRRLEEGSFFARADVAAYQVELDGDVMPYLAGGDAAYLVGTYSADGHRFELRAEEASAGTTVLFTNFTSGKAKLLTREGAFVFSGKRLHSCDAVSNFALFADLSVQSIADDVDFETVEMHRGQAPADFIAVAATKDECVKLTVKQGNMSTAEALERFPTLANEFQTKDMASLKTNMFKTEGRRQLSENAEKKASLFDLANGIKELTDLMMHPNSHSPMAREDVFHADGARRLAAAKHAGKARKLSDTVKAYTMGPGNTQITNFELWIATRMADPTFITSINSASSADADWAAVSQYIGAEYQLDLSGQYGISNQFAWWSGFQYAGQVMPDVSAFVGEIKPESIKLPTGIQEDVDYNLLYESLMIYSHAFPGSCAGGFTKASKKKDASAMCGKQMSESAMQLCEGGMQFILKPMAWASFLYKDSEIVLAFQGTQMHKFSMMQYTFKADPIFFEYVNYFNGHHSGAVVTEGLALYMFQLINCVDSIYYAIPGKVGYITGHSLGGSAATLYAQLQMGSPTPTIGTETFLVTFGAPATASRECLGGQCPELKYFWGSRGITAVKDANLMMQKIASIGLETMFAAPSKCLGFAMKVAPGQVSFIPGSIRFLHKFDPIPSMGFGFGRWSHMTESAMVLFDMPGCKSNFPACSNGLIASTSPHPAGSGNALEGYLCDKGVQASGKMFMCAPEYYSYTNMMNPFPCVETILAQTYLYDPSSYAGWAPFIPFENVVECTTSYVATVEAYFFTYLASDIESVRNPLANLNTVEDALMLLGFYAAWGVFYVHQTYPNYAMCVSSGTGYGDYEHMDAPVTPSENGVADVMGSVNKNIPGFDDEISWFDGGKQAKKPAVSNNVYIATPTAAMAFNW